MSLSVEKLEASLEWALEKYGEENPLVRSLKEQLRIRRAASVVDSDELDSLAEELQTETDAVPESLVPGPTDFITETEPVAPAPASKVVTPPPAPKPLKTELQAPLSSHQHGTEPDLAELGGTLSEDPEVELPSLQVGERLGRRRRD